MFLSQPSAGVGPALTALSLAATLGLAASSQAQTVLYSDTFSRVEGSGDFNNNPAGPGNGSADWGTNDNGLGGTVSQDWIVGPAGRSGGANQVTDGSRAATINGGAFYNFDAAAISPLGFSVQFDFNRDADGDGTSGDGYLVVGLGVDTTAGQGAIGGGGFALNNSDVAVLFQQAMGGNAGNTEVFVDGVNPNAGNPSGPLDYGNPNALHTALIVATPQVAGMYGETDLIDISVSVDGGSAYSFTATGGDGFGTLSFSSNNFVNRAYDNVIVSTVIPEPTGLALLGLGGLGLLTRRRSAK